MASQRVFDIRPVCRSVSGAQTRRMQTPPGETFWPLGHFIDPAGWGHVWRTVEALKQHHHPTAARFFGDVTLGLAIVDELGDRPRLRTLRGLAECLRRRSEAGGRWLVLTPLGNTEPSPRAIRLSDQVVLMPVDERRLAQPSPGAMAVMRECAGDSLTPYLRFERHADIGEVDTRITACLFSVEETSLDVARSRARTRASYCLAVWSLLNPPTDHMAWPSVASWVPQPWVDVGIHTKPYEPGPGPKTSTTARTIENSEYPLPNESDLQLAVEAIDAAAKSRWATAVLSAAWQLFVAARVPNALERADRMLHVICAREALCEPPVPGEGEAERRWNRLLNRLPIREPLWQLGYSRREVQRIESRVVQARNIAAHGADSFLLNFGYPAGTRRLTLDGRRIPARDLNLAVVAADLPPMITLVSAAVRELLLRAKRASWDDGQLEQLLGACKRE